VGRGQLKDGKDRRERDGHGLSKVLLGPAIPYPFTPCGQPPLKRSYIYFSGGRLQDGRPRAAFYPLRYPTPYASDADAEMQMEGGRKGKGGLGDCHEGDEEVPTAARHGKNQKSGRGMSRKKEFMGMKFIGKSTGCDSGLGDRG
jgi:hypothetical protein